MLVTTFIMHTPHLTASHNLIHLVKQISFADSTTPCFVLVVNILLVRLFDSCIFWSLSNPVTPGIMPLTFLAMSFQMNLFFLQSVIQCHVVWESCWKFSFTSLLWNALSVTSYNDGNSMILVTSSLSNCILWQFEHCQHPSWTHHYCICAKRNQQTMHIKYNI